MCTLQASMNGNDLCRSVMKAVSHAHVVGLAGEPHYCFCCSGSEPSLSSVMILGIPQSKHE